MYRMMKRAIRLSLALYAALLVAPIATLFPAPTWPAFAGGAVLGGAFGYGVSGSVDHHSGLGSLPSLLTGFFAPLGWLWPAVEGAESAVSFFLSPWFAGVLAVVPWFVAVVVAYEWRARERIDGLTERVVFEARNPPETRRQVKIAAGVVMVMKGAGVVMTFALGSGDSVYLWLPLMVPVWIPILVGSDGREVAIADGGLRVERQIHEWEHIDGYELTDDALTVTRPAWYRTDLSFDRSDVEDIDAVTALLDEQFERAPVANETG